MASNRANLRFSDVDSNPAAKALIEHQDLLNANTSVQKQKHITFDLMQIQPGDHVLDIGSGLGDDVAALSQRIGPEGQAIGIANSELMINIAKSRHNTLNNCHFHYGDVYYLDFPDHSFHSIRADRVFMHLTNREAALSEMIRVLKPQGNIVINEPDLRTFLMDPKDYEVNKLYIDYLSTTVTHPYCGFELPCLLAKAGLQHIKVETTSLTFFDANTAIDIFTLEQTLLDMIEIRKLSTHQANTWLDHIRYASATPHQLIASATQYAVCGTYC